MRRKELPLELGLWLVRHMEQDAIFPSPSPRKSGAFVNKHYSLDAGLLHMEQESKSE